jgi:hypothetical protein
MTGTVFKFEGTGCTATVEASYDVGWLDHLNCSGAGGWRDEIKLNDEDAAICGIRNIRTGARVSVCGIRWIGSKWTWSVIPLNDAEGITFTADDTGVTVNCADSFTVEYESSVISGVDN